MDSPEPEMHAIHLPLTLLKCFNHIKKQSILKEINSAEHEYMNISPPPPPIIKLATALEQLLLHQFVFCQLQFY